MALESGRLQPGPPAARVRRGSRVRRESRRLHLSVEGLLTDIRICRALVGVVAASSTRVALIALRDSATPPASAPSVAAAAAAPAVASPPVAASRLKVVDLGASRRLLLLCVQRPRQLLNLLGEERNLRR